MNLEAYLSETGQSAAAFARKIGADPANVSRWKDDNRMPSKEWMITIFDATDGKVTPNDFYGIDEASPAA